MSRFDLYRGTGNSDYLLDVQADFLSTLRSRIVIPVVEEKRMSIVIPRLHLNVEINGASYYVVTNMIGAVSTHGLGRPVGSLTHYGLDITASIDFLLQGF
jgi:hypothetical protein